MFAFSSWSTDFVLGYGALFVLWLQVPPALRSEVFEKFEKLGPTWVNVHTPWLAFKALRSGLLSPLLPTTATWTVPQHRTVCAPTTTNTGCFRPPPSSSG